MFRSSNQFYRMTVFSRFFCFAVALLLAHAALAEDYVFVAGDRVLIRAGRWDHTTFRFEYWDGVSGEYSLSANGDIHVPLAGTVRALGETADSLSAAVTLQIQRRIGLTDPPGEGPRLQDLVAGGDLEVTVHDGFGFWVADVEASPEIEAALEQADAAAAPTARLTSVEAAYWTDVGTKEHLRWVMPHDEDPLLDALSRLHAAGRDGLVEGSRLVGMFRAYGLLAPVWDLETGTGAAVLEDPAATFAATASVPSFMPSVSRFGLATEPQSR